MLDDGRMVLILDVEKILAEMSPKSDEEVFAGLEVRPETKAKRVLYADDSAVLARAGSPASAATRGEVWVDATIKGQLPPAIGSWPGIIASIPDIDDNAIGHGLINGQPDRDGVVRSVPLLGRAGGQVMPGLALEMARVRLGAGEIVVSGDRLSLDGLTIPVDERGRMRLHFGHVPPAAIASAEDVLGRRIPPGYFRGRVVLVGLGARPGEHLQEGLAPVVVPQRVVDRDLALIHQALELVVLLELAPIDEIAAGDDGHGPWPQGVNRLHRLAQAIFVPLLVKRILFCGDMQIGDLRYRQHKPPPQAARTVPA